MELLGTIGGDIGGLTKGGFNLTNNRMNISFSFTPTILQDTIFASHTLIRIYSLDNSHITGLQFYNDGDLLYYNGGGYTNLLGNTISINNLYDFNLYIDFDIDLVIFILKENGILIERFTYPLGVLNKQGLNKIDFRTLCDNDDIIIKQHSIGIYSDGISEANEFGLLTVDLNKNTYRWDFENENLFTIIANGYFALGSVSTNHWFEATFPYGVITGLETFTINNVLSYDELSLQFGNKGFQKFIKGYNEFQFEINLLNPDNIHSELRKQKISDRDLREYLFSLRLLGG